MALAKNLMESGNWGLRSNGFQGVSSSPLWTLLMSAAYRFVGPSEITPLVLNLICGCGVVLVIYFAGNRRQLAEILDALHHAGCSHLVSPVC